MKKLLAACLSLGLSGCFVSQEPLVGPEDAVFPYETITYRDSTSGEETTIVHRGDAYVVTEPAASAAVELLFEDIGDGLYLAQVKGDAEKGQYNLVYGVVTVDFDRKSAKAYMAVAKEGMQEPGLKDCGDGTICIEDLDAYLKRAREAIAAGAEPDATYEIIAAQ